jgi:hypothetical protein
LERFAILRRVENMERLDFEKPVGDKPEVVTWQECLSGIDCDGGREELKGSNGEWQR